MYRHRHSHGHSDAGFRPVAAAARSGGSSVGRLSGQKLFAHRGLQAIAQNGLTYATEAYDRERYQAVREVAAEMMAARAGTDSESVLDLFANESGYATPKVDVRGAAFRDDGVLLVPVVAFRRRR